jgi:hypothetical protein
LAKESGYVDRIVKEQQKQNYIRAIWTQRKGSNSAKYGIPKAVY